ncbi:MAG: SUMF1/EgtB/PvdO family nonheme iron enzyme [Lentisphaeria bacterium]|jgi:formylglycine-generating enzyme required for sulfatase activity|nr:SUMF1/EgtB/PvdO family nonheme iron enzyme [Lentisphaeria bacterium]
MTGLLPALLLAVCFTGCRTVVETSAGTAIRHPADGAVMVYVPAGAFTMGLSEGDAGTVAKDLGQDGAASLWAWEAYPKRVLQLDGYFIDKYEVTVTQWQAYAAATGAATPNQTERHFDTPAAPLIPAATISWKQAQEYAAWAGKVLPSEAQWEKAARGPDGRLYPWGNTAPTPDRGHFGSREKVPDLYALVGSYPGGASPYGALDMLGNQYEWTSEWLAPYPGNPLAYKMDDYTPDMNGCLRGGSWYHGWVGFYAAKRFGLPPDETHFHVGMRTAWLPPRDYFESAAFRRDRAAAKKRERQLARIRQSLAE